jgi:16S rRNA G966 N2-methylase RsmD
MSEAKIRIEYMALSQIAQAPRNPKDHKAEIALLWHNTPKFRMVWTDPPYGVDYAGKNEYLNRGDRGNRIQKTI